MFQRLTKLAAVVAMIGSFVAVPATATYAQTSNENALVQPITGTVGKDGSFAGTVAISRFAEQDGALVAIGKLSGTVYDKKGAAVRNIVASAAWPVTRGNAGGASCSDDVSSMQQACDVLNLVLGPLHLDLLGLVVDLNQVVLDITAQPGAGNLLGNLLCAITGLFDAGGPLANLVLALNQLLGALAAL